MSILVIDVGTSGIRAAVVRPDATVAVEHYREVLPDTPMAGLVEFDANVLADVALELAARALADAGPVDGVGITNQRASAIVWDRATGEPIGPALGWQDLRTVTECLVFQADGLRFAPNQSATKVAWLLNTYDPERARDLCFGTPDAWIVWRLSQGALHVTDLSNAAVTGLINLDGGTWDDAVLTKLDIPAAMMPTIVDSMSVLGTATALDGAPPIAGILGDQQASMLGQGVVEPGPAKITFGTGGMLDVVVGPERPRFDTRGGGGTFPIVAWRRAGARTWGLEAIMLSAGTNIEWLRDDLGILTTSAESHDVAAQCDSTDGVMYVPALMGLGTPKWDYGARGTLLGLTRGAGRPQIVRAVLEGVAQRGADLVDAAEADGAPPIAAIRVDGGMSRNDTFVQLLADATQRRVEVSPVIEATTMGAAFAAGLALGTWAGLSDIAATWAPTHSVAPGAPLDRDRWADAVRRAGGWFPELSGLDF
ncbi:MAG TPA: FGGY family carbohydrate kinase [Acidimicrobiales bacterium]